MSTQPPPPPAPPAPIAPPGPPAPPPTPPTGIDAAALQTILDAQQKQFEARMTAELDRRFPKPPEPKKPDPTEQDRITALEAAVKAGKDENDAIRVAARLKEGKDAARLALANRVEQDAQDLLVESIASKIIQREDGAFGVIGTAKVNGVDVPNSFIPIKDALETELAKRPSLDLKNRRTVNLPGNPIGGFTGGPAGAPQQFGNTDALTSFDLIRNVGLGDAIFEKDPTLFATIMARKRRPDQR